MPAVGTEDLVRYILGPSKKAGNDVDLKQTQTPNLKFIM